jgi:hypothetical protein
MITRDASGDGSIQLPPGVPRAGSGRMSVLGLDDDWLFGRIANTFTGGHAMLPRAQARYAARAKVVKAMAHPTRLFLVSGLCAQLSAERRFRTAGP